jgi:hypothetical protein
MYSPHDPPLISTSGRENAWSEPNFIIFWMVGCFRALVGYIRPKFEALPDPQQISASGAVGGVKYYSS